MVARLLLILACLIAIAAGGCGGGGPAGDDDGSVPAETPAEEDADLPPTPARPVRGRFDVGGGRKLFLRCRGPASDPTIVYVHPYVADDSGAGSRDAGFVTGFLEERHRTCVYDRANVGRSDEVTRRQTGADSVRDLRRLLTAARVEGPYVLVGSGFGGLLADMYAATHPEDVAGLVLVDAPLPGDLDVEERFFPSRLRLQPNAWVGTIERLDRHATFAEAQRLSGDEPQVPLTYVGPEDLTLDPSLDGRRVTAVIRDLQASFVERFAPGRLVLVDSARPMEAVVPDRIAEEVDRVVQEVREAAQER